MVYTVTYHRSLWRPEVLPPTELLEVCLEEYCALVEAEDGKAACARLKSWMEEKRGREEHMLEPKRERWQQDHPEHPFHVSLIYTAFLPICVDRWKAAEGRQPNVRYSPPEVIR